MTLFWYGLPFGLMASIAPCFLGNCKVRSFDLYLKKLPCNTVYILLQNSIKHPCSTRDLGPHVLSLSLSSWFPGARRPAAQPREYQPLSFFHFLIVDFGPPGSGPLKDPNTCAPQPLSPCPTVWGSQLLKSMRPRAHALKQEKPPQWEAHTPQERSS